MFIGVDGSSSGDPEVYRQVMSGSFIQQLVSECPEQHKRYFRGPDELSLTRQVTHIAAEVEGYIQARVGQHRDTRLLLAGYSRGGATCIAVAQRLRRNPWATGLVVECLALFDAVDRDAATSTAVIPGNVLHAYHAMRDPSVQSRWYFGNCGTRIESPGVLESQSFRATHSGMGALPWEGDHPSARYNGPGYSGNMPLITEEQDRTGSEQVHRWMWNHIRRHGVVR